MIEPEDAGGVSAGWTRAMLNTPNVACVCNWYLHGGHNQAIDRRFGREQQSALPSIAGIVRHNRAFLRRAVLFGCRTGISQFLDIGCGVPTAGDVHELAGRTNPGSRCVHADIDHTVLAHRQLALRNHLNEHRLAVVAEDLRAPRRLLTAAAATGLIDLELPLMLVMSAVAHFVGPDTDLAAVLARYRDAVAPGSLVAVSHMTIDGVPQPWAAWGERFRRGYAQTNHTLHYRSWREFEDLFQGWELLSPGMAWAPQWNPDTPPDTDPALAMTMTAVARRGTDGQPQHNEAGEPR
ncbi:methyltransferase [Solihabitans fulvus]|uniref:Methyltransferase n=1 Tax=Solihabitans fulvus TaxID=1892852 RepID=A0A5B2WT99_9PSEU|nr:SAM-dependent methyltransferase [Solihabitans fulvus]KAA2253087.1 methyltransferase [Solihabitans fulvus]